MGMIIVLELLVRPKRQAVFFSSGYSRTLNRGDQNPMSFFFFWGGGVGGWGGGGQLVCFIQFFVYAFIWF